MASNHHPNRSTQIREVAESLVGSTSSYQRILPIGHSISSVNYISDDVIAGSRHGNRMSSIRRFFCLFVTFDLLFTCLMWLICIMLMGENIVDVVTREIARYTIFTSLFDIVIAASIRFIFLILFYGMIQINNWSVIALSTACTCAFLVAKVFYYHWQVTTQPFFPVLLVLTSFTLSWGEAWFLDFRVLPQENQANELINSLASQHQQTVYPFPNIRDTVPLLRDYLQQQSEYRSHYAESNDNFQSPLDSPESSPKLGRKYDYLAQNTQADNQYRATAKESLNEAWRILNSKGWKLERKGDKPDDIIESIVNDKYGKIYRLTAVVKAPPDFLYESIFKRFEDLPKWNPTISEAKIVKRIDATTDIVYQVTNGGGSGMVAARDFVTLRKFAKIETSGLASENGDVSNAGDDVPLAYVSSAVGIELAEWPPTKKYVRGDNPVGCWVTRPIRTPDGHADPEKLIFQWLMGVNIKGRIPIWVLNKALTTAMTEFLGHMRKFIASNKNSGR